MLNKCGRVLIIIVSMWCCTLSAQDIYVSPSGDDNNSGEITAPFKTIQKALNALKGVSKGKTLWLREGSYDLTETLSITGNLSGTEEAPFVISGYSDERVIINGGFVLPVQKTKLLKDELNLKRLPVVARGKVHAAVLSEESFKNLFPGKDEYNKVAQISWNGVVLPIAQFPNRGYGYIKEVIDEGPSTRWLAPDEKPEPYSESNPTGGSFKIREQIDFDMMKTEFDRTKDMLLRGYLDNDWFFDSERIGGISDDGTIKLLRYTRYGINDEKGLDRRINIYNALCQLDMPGEWYYDRRDRILYIWPPGPIVEDYPLTISGSHVLLDGSNVSNISLRNITFENFGDHGVRLTESNNISVLGCEFRSSTGLALRLSGTNNLIKSSDFHHLNQAFVLGSSNSNNVKNLVDEKNVATNNHIYSCTHKGYGMVGLGGVGTRFTNNLLHNLNSAVIYGSNDCILEYNEFYDMGFEMGDWNPIYAGAGFHTYGNEVRYNFIHHLMETPLGFPVAGVRNDDFGHGLKVHHNVFYKSGRSAAEFSGTGNKVTDCIVLQTRYLWWTFQVPQKSLAKSLWDSKGTFLADRFKEYEDNQVKIANKQMSANAKENYLGRGEIFFGVDGRVSNGIKQNWLDHYPFISKHYNFDDPDGNPWMQCYDTLTNNYSWGSKSFPFHTHGPNNVDGGELDDLREWLPNTALVDMPITTNPTDIFEDFDNLDLRIKDSFTGIPGFKDFDLDQVGLFLDEYRTEMPDKKAYREKVFAKYDGIQSTGGAFDHDKVNERYDLPEYPIVDLVTDIGKNNSEDRFLMGRSKGELIIYGVEKNRTVEVEVVSISGHSVYRSIEYHQNAPLRINISGLTQGLYILSIKSEEGVQEEKFIID